MSSFLGRCINLNKKIKRRMKSEQKMMKLSVYAGLMFAVMEILMAFYANSQAVLMDSIYDLAEAVVLALVIFLIPLFYKPVSERKPFGYGQVESILILGKGFLLIAVTVGLILGNIQMIIHGGNEIDHELIGMFEFSLSLISAVVLVLLLYMNHKQYSNLIDAEIIGWKIDVFSSIGVGIAFILGSLLDHTSFSHLACYVDQVIAIIIALIMLPQPIKMIRESFKSIVLFAPEDEIVDEIKACASELFDDYAYEITFYDIIQTGRKLWIEIYVKSKSNMINVTQLQHLKENIEKLLRKDFKDVDVQITPDLVE